ncbi:MAG: hypothetical protein ACRDOE_13495, partial [Streptosporangiaceae bacterium]
NVVGEFGHTHGTVSVGDVAEDSMACGITERPSLGLDLAPLWWDHCSPKWAALHLRHSSSIDWKYQGA